MKTNLYKELTNKQSQEVNNFPIMFAFSNEQFNEGMTKLGLECHDVSKICSIGGGGYIKKSDSMALNEMGKNHRREMDESIENDKTGDGFVYDMFHYELNNHEYSYTYEIEDTLRALGLTVKEVNANRKLFVALERACRDVKKENN